MPSPLDRLDFQRTSPSMLSEQCEATASVILVHPFLFRFQFQFSRCCTVLLKTTAC